ncbi:MAG TPA: YtxH domain-containing protein [Smithellaceae bacterium]|nr:YtxH domain-containing protein [Smithellaceae bacterium]
MSERTGDLFKGLVIGGLIGAALGILFAPKSGKETREDIGRKTDEIISKAKEEYEKAVEKSKLAYEAAVKRLGDLQTSAKAKVEEVETKVTELASQGAETIQDNKTRLKKAIDAGVEAYREEKSKKPA